MSADEATPDDAAPGDERCASLLAACHEALLAGEAVTPLTGSDVPPELKARLQRDLAPNLSLGPLAILPGEVGHVIQEQAAKPGA